MAQWFATRTPIFTPCERFTRIASNLRFAISSPPKARFAKKGVQFGNPEMIRENPAIRANLRSDSRKSGHLSRSPEMQLICLLYLAQARPLKSLPRAILHFKKLTSRTREHWRLSTVIIEFGGHPHSMELRAGTSEWFMLSLDEGLVQHTQECAQYFFWQCWFLAVGRIKRKNGGQSEEVHETNAQSWSVVNGFNGLTLPHD